VSDRRRDVGLHVESQILHVNSLFTVIMFQFLYCLTFVNFNWCLGGTYCVTPNIIVFWLACNVTEQLLQNTQYRGFPVVVSQELRFLVGYVARRDLTVAIGLSVCLSVCLSLSQGSL